MKHIKKSLIVILLILFCTCFFVACSEDTQTITYTVTLKSEISPYQLDESITAGDFIDYNGIYDTIEVKKDGIIGNINVPSTEKYHFQGWYTDESYTIQWNTLLDPVKGNITLFAKWEITQ